MTKLVNWDESKMIVLKFQRTRSLSSGEVFAGYLVTSPRNYLAIGKIATKNTFRKYKSIMTYKPRGRG